MRSTESTNPALLWLAPGQSFPPVSRAWGPHTPAPGLLAASHEIDTGQLLAAYQQGIFPWFSAGQPVLWWSPDPRMVLQPHRFRLRRSLRQSLQQWLRREGAELVFDRDFEEVMQRCASSPRPGQSGTWITASMVQAYTGLHRLGLAHSAELRLHGELLAGLYFVALGHALFGESMFTTVSDGSKLALCLLVSVARRHGVALIDCQQNTPHLASLGAGEIEREDFVRTIRQEQNQPAIDWRNERLYWETLDSDPS